jgi:hypothetical protein
MCLAGRRKLYDILHKKFNFIPVIPYYKASVFAFGIILGFELMYVGFVSYSTVFTNHLMSSNCFMYHQM